ncbi:CblZ, a non-orthologous displasment for Alpha-ribazole-5'-phosphate phosphatase [Microbacterium esteraromaticum]|uniref:CblZ, a non-orthologous displasment for Alpha-ribazole-5'-phosphate phosphatase n=1 Tax=Microbacterium esteraromaticum TaxID=57043 RepID=A0A1R4IHI9_9MICO|nr:DUF3043 domain-containing protein [Microbacterium esteraromaticum]SJN19270.1 CblZ, a non-orthologous displasment for Alpha-ribazole-5'-phosphate phosphatase [Microbacterium esteraromaticum]
MPNPTPAANDDAPETPAVGKGRATPTRAEREAANRRPLVANTKEARAAAKADLQVRRERARVGMEKGEDKYLPARDKGPQRRWVRDYVDAGWHVAEWLMAAMLLVILLNLVPIQNIQLWAMAALWGFMLIAITDMVILSIRVKKKAAAKFGADRREKGLGWYAAMRALQMRFMRLPKPQAKRGQYPD